MINNISFHVEEVLLPVPFIFRRPGGQQFADDLVNRGELQISTLFSFRDYEKEGQRDETEGGLERRVDRMTRDSPNFDRFADEAGIHAPSGFLSFYDTDIYTEVDGYAISCTQHDSPELMRGPFGDSCVRITDPYLFFRTLTSAINRELELETAIYGHAQYIGRQADGNYVDPCPPGLRKPVDGFEHQKEIRMIWYPKVAERPLRKRIIRCAELGRFCSIV